MSDSSVSYRELFEQAPVALCVLEIDELVTALRVLRRDGVGDLRAHLRDEDGETLALLGKMRLLQLGGAAREVLGAEATAARAHFVELLPDEVAAELLCMLAELGDEARQSDADEAALAETRCASTAGLCLAARLLPGGEGTRVYLSLTRLSPLVARGTLDALKNENRRLAHDLDRTASELAQVAYAASHDLQEPLRMVTSYVQLLERRYGYLFDEYASKYVGYAVEGAKRMQTLLRDVVALYHSEIEPENVKLVHLDDIVDRVRDALYDQLVDTGAVLTRGELPSVVGDPKLLVSMFRHLIHNAIKFAGSAPPRVSITAEPIANRTPLQYRFVVRDRGIGFDAEVYGERVFELFRRLHPRGAYPGTGVGLTIARKIAECHGGSMFAEAQPGQGTSIVFTLPVVETPEPEDTSAIRLPKPES
ncbi:sensor histidine kinase [Haliangium ochraceum]|uniref:histidine kinase n=1 Tax=Haliangium ochraceum (strain DSM 14365 / JCM 11303 / SMP-2) TaxID=502025 RepID=D0LRA6_HALO1|nr:ATP-binding protein [Haliangium ochraceum]ACY17134.1 histidine kinase [Haliangium ochraceum DSM 14365]